MNPINLLIRILFLTIINQWNSVFFVLENKHQMLIHIHQLLNFTCIECVLLIQFEVFFLRCRKIPYVNELSKRATDVENFLSSNFLFSDFQSETNL